jgi:hypothetical protein
MDYVKFSISWVTVLILTRPRKKDIKDRERWKDKWNRVVRKIKKR